MPHTPAPTKLHRRRSRARAGDRATATPVWATAALVMAALVGALAGVGCSNEAPLADAPAGEQPEDDSQPDASSASADAGPDAVSDAGERAPEAGAPPTDAAPDPAAEAGADDRDDFDIEDCNALCDSLGVLGCQGPSFECLQDCAVSVVAFMGTRCKALYVEMIECGQVDLLARFECDSDGVPAIRADVCTVEQAELIECVQSGG